MPTLRTAKLLISAYLALSIVTVAAVAVLSRADPRLVNDQAWVRSVILAATSLLTFAFAAQAARGDARALLRLRIVVTVLLISVVAVLLFLPLPSWMRWEQAACGLLLLATAFLAFKARPTT